MSTQKDLGLKARTALLWSGGDAFLRHSIGFAITIILARLLSPEDFGTIALLYLFIGIATVIVDSGLSSALIQRQETTHSDECTVFWFNAGIGIMVACTLWFSATSIAHFYELSILAPLCKLFAVNVIIGAFGAIQKALMTKRLDFKTQMKISATATLIAGAVAVLMATFGFGVWALAAQTLVTTMVTTVMLWLMSDWRPCLKYSVTSARTLFGFGSYMLLSSLLNVIYSRIYTLLIGKYYGVRDLGFYERAEGMKQLPVGALSDVISRVAFPVFSAAANDRIKLRRGARLALRGIMYINVPMMLGLMVSAEAAIATVFGDQWRPATPIFQVLCLGGVLFPLHVINLNLLTAQGYAKLYFRLEILKRVIGTVLIIIGSFFGIMGIAWSQAVLGVVSFIINAHYSGEHINYGARQQIVDFLPVVAISVPMAIVTFVIGQNLSLSPALVLGIQVGTGLLLFVTLSALFRLSALKDMIGILPNRSR